MMSHKDQYEEYDRMRMERTAEREKRVRELALTMSERGHIGATAFAITHKSPMFNTMVAMLPAHSTITVDLHPALRGTQEGVLIAEIMIRDAWDCAAEGLLDK